MSIPLVDLTAHQQAESIQRGECTAVDLIQQTYARIEAVDGRPPTSEKYVREQSDLECVHAYITLTKEDALRRAGEIDAAVAAGEQVGPLAGVPLAVKDNLCVRGTPSTAGSRILEEFVSPYTATAVERLVRAGAVVVGKVNLDEFTFGSSNESSAFLPPVGNPWNTTHVPGGSSGGSTAAVAAGEAALSLGSDTAGSIRQPASFCGVVGMKPTYGRVSRYGLIAFASSLDCVGPIGRDVRDVAGMLKVIAGPDPRDATAAELAVPDYLQDLDTNLQGVRIGLSPDYTRLKIPDPDTGELQEQPISPEIEAAVSEAAEFLARQGATIVENVQMPHTHFGIPVYFVISRVEAASNLHRYDGVKYGYRIDQPVDDLAELYRLSRGVGFGPQPKLRILMGMYVSAEQYEKGYYERALRARTLIRRDFERAFDPEGEYALDCLLTATTPTTAFKIGAVYGDSVLMQYADMLTVAANHAGIPALSVPAGLDDAGLPIGLQLLGPDFSEAKLLKIGRAYERSTESAGWRSMRPAVLTD